MYIIKTTDETKNRNIVIRHVELDDLDSVRKLAETIIDTEPFLHILVNNAGE